VGPEEQNNYLNVSGLESGSDYEFVVVAMNNDDETTSSTPVIVRVGEQAGLSHSSFAVPSYSSPFCNQLCSTVHCPCRLRGCKNRPAPFPGQMS